MRPGSWEITSSRNFFQKSRLALLRSLSGQGNRETPVATVYCVSGAEEAETPALVLRSHAGRDCVENPERNRGVGTGPRDRIIPLPLQAPGCTPHTPLCECEIGPAHERIVLGRDSAVYSRDSLRIPSSGSCLPDDAKVSGSSQRLRRRASAGNSQRASQQAIELQRDSITKREEAHTPR